MVEMIEYDSIRILAKIISRGGVLIFGDFMLASGRRTQYYLDFGMLSNKPSYLRRLIDLIKNEIARLNYKDVTKVVGILNKGILFIPPLSMKLKVPFALLSRKCDRLVLGQIDSSDKILLFDDMISSGRTIERAINAIRLKFRAEVKKIFIILDREEGGSKRIRRLGYQLDILVKICDLTDVLYEMGYITDEERDIIYSEARCKSR